MWEEAIIQTEGMLESWRDQCGQQPGYIIDIREDTMSLPFNVINKAGFGVDLPWSSKGAHHIRNDEVNSADDVGKGHSMTYREAMHATMDHLIHIVIFPSWLLRIAPFRYARMLYTAHVETIKYLNELMQQKEDDLMRQNSGKGKRLGFDLMSALVATKIQHREATTDKSGGTTVGNEEALTDQAILANVFLMMIAGHETTAHTLLVTLLHMALHLDWQREVQRDLDRIVGDRRHELWRLQTDAQSLGDGKVGATINEVLRLFPPANIIPKGTRAGESQIVKTRSGEFTIPEKSALQFHVAAVHHHPKYWPIGPSSVGHQSDLGEFQPQRWFVQTDVSAAGDPRAGHSNSEQAEATRDERLSSIMPSSLFRPHPGAFIPFSTGQRGCIGRRFAQVEMLAVVAVIFKDYSLELDVGEYANEAAVGKMSFGERKALYEKARSDLKRVLREGIRHHLTMQLKEGRLALRLVMRGAERFSQAYE